jgi:hypothetical protein
VGRNINQEFAISIARYINKKSLGAETDKETPNHDQHGAESSA